MGLYPLRKNVFALVVNEAFEAMDILFDSLGPGVHCYSPFFKPSSTKSDLNLGELCKSVILKCITVRRLSVAVRELPLPKPLLRYVTDLTTLDFQKIECAPFSDAFSFNFLHRALTYRVMCLRDGQEYMITYGYSPVEEQCLKTDHKEWVKAQHKNVMCICASVRDPSTDNIFYVYDQPYVSMEQMWSVFCDRKQPVPETFFWRLTYDICEALKYMLTNGLQYGHFGLNNIYIVGDRLVLENGLMRKNNKYGLSYAKEYEDEHAVLCCIICILKCLVRNYDDELRPSSSLKNFISDIEEHQSLDIALQMVNESMKNVHSFSFTQLIQSLQS